MWIDTREIAQLKKTVDLRAVIEGAGVELKKNGRKLIGRCPFHDDQEGTFTLNPRTRTWTCSGCPDGGIKGDVVNFIMKVEDLTAETALERLRDLAGVPVVQDEAQPADPPAGTRRLNLLGRVAEYYRQHFRSEPKARNYLRAQGITSEDTLKVFCAGYCDGTLREALGIDGHVSDDLVAIGLLTDRGELFAGCVVFPTWDLSGRCAGMCGWRIDRPEEPTIFLPGGKGLLNWRAAARSEKMVLSESVLDAMAVHQAGVASVVPCLGTEGFTEMHRSLLDQYPPKEIVLCFAADESSRTAAAELAVHVSGRCRVRLVDLPDGSAPTSMVMAERADDLRRLVLGLPVSPQPQRETPGERMQELSARLSQGFVLARDDRRYEVRGLAPQGLKLHATVKVWREGGGEDEFELSTLDLHSGRSRRWFASQIATQLGAAEDVVRLDLNALVREAEGQVAEAPAEVRVEVSDEERAVALDLLRSPKLLAEILSDYETVGHTGEETNKLLGYLVAVSRKLDAPLSLMIQSRSGAGKSALQEAILAFVPEEDFHHYSRITDQALFYSAENALVHKLLAVEETTGMGGAAYSIRAIQSSNKLRIAATGKDPLSGRMRTEEYLVRGPVGVLLTTTQTDFDEETLSRFICVTVDESSEMTRQILRAQREAETLDGILRQRRAERVVRRHRNAQRLLEPITVVNPFAPRLVFPTERIGARRDHKKYLGLIRAVTLLHQQQREHKTAKDDAGEALAYIETTLEDIANANEIAACVLRQSGEDVTPQGRRLLGLIRQMLTNGHGSQVDADGVGRVTRRQVRENTGWSDWQVRTHLTELVELEYIHVCVGRRGKEYLYELGDGAGALGAQPAFGLTDVAELGSALGSVATPSFEAERANFEDTNARGVRRKRNGNEAVQDLRI